MIAAEHDLQLEVMTRLSSRAWPVIPIAVPNSLWIPAYDEAERRLVARIIGRMKSTGLMTVGAPDICLFWSGGGAMVELKRPRTVDLFGRISPAGRPSTAQSEIAERARKLGINHALVSSWEQLRGHLDAWGVA